jgi:hypothetical protein
MSPYLRRALLGCLLAGAAPVASAASGQAIDMTTKQPLADARIRMECSVGVNIESERMLRTVTAVTDAHGEYAFSLQDRLGCQFIRMNGSLRGYAFYGSNAKDPILGHEIPTLIYFLPASKAIEEGFAQAQAWANTAAATVNGHNDRQYYLTLLSYFRNAIAGAREPADAARVRALYCPALADAYAKAPEDMEAAARSANANVKAGSLQPHTIVRSTYDAYVVPNCGAHTP